MGSVLFVVTVSYKHGMSNCFNTTPQRDNRVSQCTWRVSQVQAKVAWVEIMEAELEEKPGHGHHTPMKVMYNYYSVCVHMSMLMYACCTYNIMCTPLRVYTCVLVEGGGRGGEFTNCRYPIDPCWNCLRASIARGWTGKDTPCRCD
jgi:hypothetical protein